MERCAHCGVELPEGSHRFCADCGAPPATGQDEAEARESRTPAPTPPPAPTPQSPAPSVALIASIPPIGLPANLHGFRYLGRSRRRRFIPWILVAIIVLAAIGAGIYYLAAAPATDDGVAHVMAAAPSPENPSGDRLSPVAWAYLDRSGNIVRQQEWAST